MLTMTLARFVQEERSFTRPISIGRMHIQSRTRISIFFYQSLKFNKFIFLQWQPVLEGCHIEFQQHSTKNHRTRVSPLMKPRQADHRTFLAVYSPVVSYPQNNKIQQKNQKKGQNVDQLNTWQNPDTPAMESRLKALARKVSRVVGSVMSFGGGPGAVGIARML